MRSERNEGRSRKDIKVNKHVQLAGLGVTQSSLLWGERAFRMMRMEWETKQVVCFTVFRLSLSNNALLSVVIVAVALIYLSGISFASSSSHPPFTRSLKAVVKLFIIFRRQSDVS